MLSGACGAVTNSRSTLVSMRTMFSAAAASIRSVAYSRKPLTLSSWSSNRNSDRSRRAAPVSTSETVNCRSPVSNVR
ncbi:hypothetical protein D3C87_2022700 [compost metagenome]